MIKGTNKRPVMSYIELTFFLNGSDVNAVTICSTGVLVIKSERKKNPQQ